MSLFSIRKNARLGLSGFSSFQRFVGLHTLRYTYNSGFFLFFFCLLRLHFALGEELSPQLVAGDMSSYIPFNAAGSTYIVEPVAHTFSAASLVFSAASTFLFLPSPCFSTREKLFLIYPRVLHPLQMGGRPLTKMFRRLNPTMLSRLGGPSCPCQTASPLFRNRNSTCLGSRSDTQS